MSSEKNRNHNLEIFKKCSADGRIALYLEKRSFFDHLTHVDPIDGVLCFDSKALKGEKVHLLITCNCRYGREDLDVLGLTFQKDLLLCTRQIWPEIAESSTCLKRKSTKNWRKHKSKEMPVGDEELAPELRLASPDCASEHTYDNEEILISGFSYSYAQRRLIARLGPKAHPFRIRLPPFTPSSITIQPSEEEVDKLCGVTYEISAYIGKRASESGLQNSGVTILIRKITQGPRIDLRPMQPSSIQKIKAPMFKCYGMVKMNLNLDRSLFYHDENVSVQLAIDNLSRLSVRKIHVSIVQLAELYMVTKGSYRSIVDKIIVHDGIPIQSGTTGWVQSFVLHAGISESNKKRGLALDGLLKNEKVTLASSTIYKSPANGIAYHETIRAVFGDVVQSNVSRIMKELQGIIVSYVVRAQCWVGLNVLKVQVPFLLMHPNMETDEYDNLEPIPNPNSDEDQNNMEPQSITENFDLNTRRVSNQPAEDNS